jgi:hypothetical protein
VALTQDQIVANNNTYLDLLDSPGMSKQAADDTSEYIRYKVREAGFTRKIIPPTENVPSFERQIFTDKPVVIYDKESDVDWAISVGYSGLPSNFYIEPRRFAVTPTLVRSPKVMKDKWTLRTAKYDIKQVFADNTVKDIQAAEDRESLRTVNTLLVGVGQVMPESGSIQYQSLSGGFSRNNVVTAVNQILIDTPFSIPTETTLVHQITWAEQMKWDRLEAGGDYSEELLTEGWSEARLFDKSTKWLVTIKRGLVPKGTSYMFGPTKFLGKSVLFTPPTMYVETKVVGWYMFQVVEEIGTTFAHTGAFARADYTP